MMPRTAHSTAALPLWVSRALPLPLSFYLVVCNHTHHSDYTAMRPLSAPGSRLHLELGRFERRPSSTYIPSFLSYSPRAGDHVAYREPKTKGVSYRESRRWDDSGDIFRWSNPPA